MNSRALGFVWTLHSPLSTRAGAERRSPKVAPKCTWSIYEASISNGLGPS